MVDSGLVRRSAAEDGGLPGVEVAVEVDDRNLAVRTVDGSQERKNDSVVATKRNDTRVVLAVGGKRDERLATECIITERREGRAMKEFLMAIFDLLDGEVVIVRGDGNIAAVDYFETREEGVHLKGYIVAAVQSQTT